MSESVYVDLWKKIDENYMTAPADADGNPQPSFLKQLELTYSPEEAALLRFLPRPGQFMSSQDVAEASDKPLEQVEQLLVRVHQRNGILGMGNHYSLPPIPLLLNHHQFYPEVKPNDLEAAELYQDYFIKDKYHVYYEGSKKGTPVMRTIPVGTVVDAGQKILSAEEAHDFMTHVAPEEMALVPCPCRTRTEKMGVGNARTGSQSPPVS